MEQAEYIHRLPTRPPDKVFELLEKNKSFEQGALVYRVAYIKDFLSMKKTKCVKVTCTECGESWYEEYVPGSNCSYSYAPFGFINSRTKEEIGSGTDTICACCGVKARALHIGNINSYGCDFINSYPVSVQLFEDKLAVFQWLITKSIFKDGSKKIIARPWEAYIFDTKKCTKFVGYFKYFTTCTVTGKWEQRARCMDTLGKVEDRLAVCIHPYLIPQSPLPNCKIDEYIKHPDAWPVTYLRLFQKHKNVENLVVQGATYTLNSYIRSAANHYITYGYGVIGSTLIKDINWKAKRPSQMLGMNKTEFAACVKYSWNNSEIELYKFLKERDGRADFEKIRHWLTIASPYGLAEAIVFGQSPTKCLKYIEKQRKKYSFDNASMTELFDYWRMLKKQKQWSSEESVAFPQRLKSAHDAVAEQIKEEETAHFKESFLKRFEKLDELSWNYKGLVIRPVKTPKELYLEGKSLHHCVASYTESHAKGKTAIFFIRRESEPENSYFTLELNEESLMVRQNRGKNNCSRTELVSEFEEAWLEHIKYLRGKKNERTNNRNDCA